MKFTGRYLFFIVAIGILIRIAAGSYWHLQATPEQNYFRLGDSLSYWVLAEQLAAGLPYQYGSPDASIFRAPAFPLFLTPFAAVDNDNLGVWLARLAGCLLGGLVVLQLFWLARAAFVATNASSQRGRAIPADLLDRVGLVAAGVGAFYPAAIGMSFTVLSEMVFMPLMIALLLCLIRTFRPEQAASFHYAAYAGVLAGLAILTRPSWLLFQPFLLAACVLMAGQNRLHFSKLILVTCGVAMMTMVPWWIRNATVTGKFVPTTLQVGPSLYDGLHANASGASDQGMGYMQDVMRRQAEEDQQTPTPESTFEYRINRRAMSEALAWASDNPRRVAELAIAKFKRTWAIWPDGGEVGSTALRAAVSISTFSVLLLAIVSSWPRRRWSFALCLCWLPCIYFTSLHMVFVGSVRYREPAMVVLIAIASFPIAQCLSSQPLRKTEP